MPASADTLSDRIEFLAPHFTIERPEGDGPFPVVVMLHGCGGRQPYLDAYAEAARDAGVAAIIIDSHTPRRISRVAAYSTVCTGMQLWGRERAGDLYAALAWARAQPWVKSDHMVAAGWSHGGWTLLDALALRSGAEMRRATGIDDLPDEPMAGVVGALFVYPYAGRASFAGRRPWRIAPDSITIIAGRDYIVGASYPRQAFARLKGAGAPVEMLSFDNNTHAYDVPEAIDLRTRYDPEATLRTQRIMIELVERTAP